MRNVLLIVSLFVATAIGGNASAQTAWIGTAKLTGSNVPGLPNVDYRCNLISYGNAYFLSLNGVNFSSCNIDVTFAPPLSVPTQMTVSCPPYTGWFTLDLVQYDL